MPFTDPHVAVVSKPEGNWELLREVVFTYEKWLYVVGVGYRTDFASVPRMLWWLVPPTGKYTAATVLHDALITHELPGGHVSSREVDRLFREGMRELGVSKPRRWLMWAGVRWGALGNKKRRKGSWGTFPGVLGLSLLALPFVLPSALLVLPLAAFRLLEKCLP